MPDAGCWMDEVRSNHDYDYVKPWHYINIEKGQSYDPSSTNNIVSALESAIEQLKRRDKYTKEQIVIDIKILMHLMGDLHQPLHTGYGADKGGNSIEVNFLGHDYNLHRVWDTEIIRHDSITADDCLNVLRHSEMPPVAKIDVVAWMNDSRSNLGAVYDFTNGTLDKAYALRNKMLIEAELNQAGLRLAFVLNSVFALIN